MFIRGEVLISESITLIWMKSIIIGTAGHIDHGKTALVKALTGIDADRLEEEKRRGITIDLGFAHLELPIQGGEADHALSPGSPTRPPLAGRGESHLQQEQNGHKSSTIVKRFGAKRQKH